MYMAMLVLDDPDRLHQVLNAWEKAGITGVTIFETTGLHRVKHRFIPMRFVTPVLEREECHVTLMAMVPDEGAVQACLSEAEGVIGDLAEPNTGVFCAWPLSVVKGTTKLQPQAD